MDVNELKLKAANRRTSNQPEARQNVIWTCNFCARSFQTETGFMGHKCAERQKLDTLQSPVGQVAYSLYVEWLRIQKRSAPNPEVFITSKYFNQFVKFAEWSAKTAIPNPNQFIKLMIDSGTQPVLWCRSNTYEMYLEWYDGIYPPERQFIESLERLQMMARDNDCELKDVFAVVGPEQIARDIKRRKISPWLLTASPVFLSWTRNLTSPFKEVVAEAINFSAFVNKLKDNTKVAGELRDACKEVGL